MIKWVWLQEDAATPLPKSWPLAKTLYWHGPVSHCVAISVGKCEGYFNQEHWMGLFPCPFSSADTPALAPPVPGHAEVALWQLWWLPQVWEHAASSPMSAELCPFSSLPDNQPMLLSMALLRLQHLQQLRRTSYHQGTLMVLLAQAGQASIAIKQLWGFLGVMRISPH